MKELKEPIRDDENICKITSLLMSDCVLQEELVFLEDKPAISNIYICDFCLAVDIYYHTGH